MNATGVNALTAHDRCDACGAQAQVRATKPRVPDTLEELEAGTAGVNDELLFCGHHHHAYNDRMVGEGWAFA